MSSRVALLGLVAGLGAWGGCGDPEGTPPEDRPVCRTVEGADARVYRWLAPSRRLLVERTAATSEGLQPSVFAYQLDEQDRLLVKEQLVAGVPEWRYVNVLDDRGNPVSTTYDWHGNVSGTTLFQNSYDDRGRLILVEQGGGLTPLVRYRYEYDEQGRVTREGIERRDTNEKPEETIYKFDAAGRVASISRRYQHGERGLTTQSYDEAGRLVSRVTDGGPYVGSTDGTPDQSTTWTYDAGGRLTERDTRGALTDVDPKGFRSYETFAPGCEAFQDRFPGIFDLPAKLDVR